MDAVLNRCHCPALLHSHVEHALSCVLAILAVSAPQIEHSLSLMQFCLQVVFYFWNDLVVEIEAKAIVGLADVLVFDLGGCEFC